MESMLSEAVTTMFLLLCSASHRFQAYAHAPAGMTWEAGFMSSLGCHRLQKACHSSVRLSEGMESMLSEAVTTMFLLLCPASHRFQAYALAHAGMTWEAGSMCSLGCHRLQKACHPSNAMLQASTAMSSQRCDVTGLNSYVIPAMAGGQRHGIYSCCGRLNKVLPSLFRLQ